MTHEWKFEATKDTPLGRTTEAAASRFEALGYPTQDFYEHWPCFIGAKNLSRFISLYDCYKRTLGLAGHIAEVGVYRGAASLFFAKLSLLYEPQTITQVHGFDLFDLAKPDPSSPTPDYIESYGRIKDLVEVQGLQRYALLHQMNVLTELKGFFEKNSHLQFKIVFLDAGTYDVVRTCIDEFWPRLTNGGIMIFDQYNDEVAPGEAKAVRDHLPAGEIVRTFPNGWMPTAYVVKGARV